MTREKFLKFFKENRILIIIIFVYICVFTLVFRISFIPTGSMEPTIQKRSFAIELRFPYIFTKNPAVNRGDIVSFSHEEANYLLCKRIIALPGETVTFHRGDVYINGEILIEDYCAKPHSTGCERVITVPEGCVFCMGDNRENSQDCRDMETPYVEIRNLKGKIMGTIHLPDIITRILKPWVR